MKGAVRFFTAGALLAGQAAWGGIGGGDIRFSVSGASSVVYSHEHHVTQKKLKCSECHYALYTTQAQHRDVTMAEMQKGRSCGACHNGERAFDVKSNCAKCHRG